MSPSPSRGFGVDKYCLSRMGYGLIRSFRHKGLKRLYAGDFKGVHAKGDLAGAWSIVVNENWRITFRIGNGDVTDVDLTDDH